MLADACYFACDEIYDTDKCEWVPINSPKQPTYFISVELDESEVRTMAVAFLSGVNEAKILNPARHYTSVDERERIAKAVHIIENSPLYIKYLPDYSLLDIENTIKRGIYRDKCQMFVLDYIATSMKIIEEIANRSSGIKLREDNVLFLLSSKLKDICGKYNVYILSATQLNQNWKSDEYPDQNLLRGSKSIADVI